MSAREPSSFVWAEPASAVEQVAIAPLPASPFVAEVVDASHPTLVGRARVRWSTARGDPDERWLPALHGLSLRRSDRVLVTQPSNWAEPIITGVIDGFATRPEPIHTGPALTLLPDERLQVLDASGRTLVEVVPTDRGPVVRIAEPHVNLEIAGKLRITAEELELTARAGGVTIQAAEDVDVRGEMINLN